MSSKECPVIYFFAASIQYLKYRMRNQILVPFDPDNKLTVILTNYRACCFFILSGFLFFFNSHHTYAQISVLNDPVYDSILEIKKQKVLEKLIQEDTVSNSAYWPNVDPTYFYSNVRKNITYPAKINQGAATIFVATPR